MQKIGSPYSKSRPINFKRKKSTQISIQNKFNDVYPKFNDNHDLGYVNNMCDPENLELNQDVF